MSLINDALKRARQAQGQSAAQTSLAPPATPPLSPVEYSRHPTAPLWVLPASGILTACSLLLLIHWWRSAPVPEVQAMGKSVPEAFEIPVQTSNVPAESSNPTEPAPALPIAAASLSDMDPVPAIAEAVASGPELIDEAPAPELHLQGIFYRGSKPIALINDQSVSIGDQVEGGSILSITRHTVTVVNGSLTNVLSLR